MVHVFWILIPEFLSSTWNINNYFNIFTENNFFDANVLYFYVIYYKSDSKAFIFDKDSYEYEVLLSRGLSFKVISNGIINLEIIHNGEKERVNISLSYITNE